MRPPRIAPARALAPTLAPTLARLSSSIARCVPALLIACAAPAMAASAAGADSMGHPRLFKGQSDYAGIMAAIRAERAPGLTAMIGSVRHASVRTIGSALKAQISTDNEAARLVSKWPQARLLEGMAEAAFGWYATRDEALLDEMRARMRLFAPSVLQRGCKGEVSEAANVVWHFALAYDFAYAALDDDEREQVLNVIGTCAAGELGDTPASLRRAPYQPLATSALSKLVGALAIVRGELPAAERLLKIALPQVVAAPSPWGGADGGYGNGSSYALWDVADSALAWDLIERVLGVPMYSKPWLAGFARYTAYTLPPGTPAGAFGDGAEVERKEEWARLGKALAYRSDTPLARWYASQLKGDDYGRLQILLSPRQFRGAARLPAVPNGAGFPSAGVAAMHSSLADPDRVSVLFKSSPYGSLNHSHADQNSFVIYNKGKVMAMDSGSYDAYGSPHWRNWYKQTRAHNAITFDGGTGQGLGPIGLGDKDAAGKLVKFASTPGYDVAVGDASAAYGGAVSRARRTLVYIRPATVVVVDQLRSAQPRSWEWNLHTVAPLAGDAQGFKVTVDGVSMCGTLDAPDALALTETPGYKPEPNKPEPSKPVGPHHWNRFALREPAPQTVFVAVLRMDCKGSTPRVAFSGDGATVAVAGRTVSVKGGEVTVGD